MDPALHRLIESSGPAAEVAVLVRTATPRTTLPDWVRVVSKFADIVTVRVPGARIAQLRGLDQVRSVKAPRTYGHQSVDLALGAPLERLDSRPTSVEAGQRATLPNSVLAEDVRRPGVGPTGRGVVVAVVDWGLDVTHPAFLKDDGTTRLLGLWDQQPGPDPKHANRFGYGRIFTPDEINAALAAANPFTQLGYSPLKADGGGGTHGTGTMSVAAGRAWPGGIDGTAPDADLLFVHLGRPGEANLPQLGDSVGLIEAIDWILEVVGDRSVVINLSMGRQGGAHLGRTGVERALDAAVHRRPGIVIVQSAGNYFNKRAHTCGRLSASGRTRLTLELVGNPPQEHTLEIWYPGADRVLVSVHAPGATQVQVRPERTADVEVGGTVVATVGHRTEDPDNGQNQIEVHLSTGAPTGQWHVDLISIDVVDGRFHGWVERDNRPGASQFRFIPSQVVRTSTTGSICNGLRTITVGAYDAHTSGRPLAQFSSSGPTMDGRGKPDLVAPGFDVLIARSSPTSPPQRGRPLSTRMSGTSFAAPAVTGIAACMLEALGAVPQSAVRRMLLESCSPAAQSADSSQPGASPINPDRIGNGYLDPGGVFGHVAAAKGAVLTENTRPWQTDPAAPADQPPRSIAALLDDWGVDAADLARAYVQDRAPAIRERLDGKVAVVAAPYDSIEDLRAGDVFVRSFVGEGQARVGQLVTGELLTRSVARARGWDLERGPNGRYALVTETGRDATDPIARLITDPAGGCPRGQAVLRPVAAAATATTAVAPTAAVASTVVESGSGTVLAGPVVTGPVSVGTLERRYFPPTGTKDAATFSRASEAVALIDGTRYFPDLHAQITALVPGDAWYLTGWVFDLRVAPIPGAASFGRLLVDAAARGVDVRVILWASRFVLAMPSLPYHAIVRINVASAEAMRAATVAGRTPLGGRVLLDYSPGHMASSHHQKSQVFVHRGEVTAYAGGIDVEQLRLDGPPHTGVATPWHDAAMRTRGDAAGAILSNFVTRWTEASTLTPATYDVGAGPKPYNPSPLVAFVTPTTHSSVPVSATTSVQVARSFPDAKEYGLLRNTPWTTLPKDGVHEIVRTFRQAIAAAQRYIYVEDQSFDAVGELFPSLVAAIRRGVKVVAVIPGAPDPADAGTGPVNRQLSTEVTTGIVNQVTAAQGQNLAVWALTGVVVHAKLMLIDDEFASIGSANFMDRSMNDTLQGDDSELTVCTVSTSTTVTDLRTQLWTEHLRVSGAAERAEVADLGRSLGFWRPGWGAGLSFPVPSSPLRFVGPSGPVPKGTVPGGPGPGVGGAGRGGSSRGP